MKKTDIAMVVFIAGVGVLIAYFLVINMPFLRLPDNGVKVQTIREISPDIVQPSDKVFNKEAINPTVEVIVGGGTSQ